MSKRRKGSTPAPRMAQMDGCQAVKSDGTIYHIASNIAILKARHIVSYPYGDSSLSNESIFHTTLVMCVVRNRSS